jgi:hypothetical protein
MVTYDPAVIQKHANDLYAQARSIIVKAGLLGGVVFAVAVGVGARRVGFGELALGFIPGAIVGAVWGLGRGAALRLQAQIALCQRQIEANTRAVPTNRVG